MDLGKPLVEYGEVDITSLLSKMTALPAEFWWSDRANREKLAGNRSGNSVFYFNDGPTCVSRMTLEETQRGIVNVLRSVRTPLFPDIAELIETFIAPHFPKCDPMRVQLAELPPGEVIKPHRDIGILGRIHRLHVPLVTHPGVEFCVSGESFHLEVGRLYELNNVVLHSVVNNSDVMRVHLLVDMLPWNLARVRYHDSEEAMISAANGSRA